MGFFLFVQKRPTMSDIADVWREYKASGDPHLQEELVVHYQGLVYKLAHKSKS